MGQIDLSCALRYDTLWRTQHYISVFLPKTYNLNLIMREHPQTQMDRLYKVIGQYSSTASRAYI